MPILSINDGVYMDNQVKARSIVPNNATYIFEFWEKPKVMMHLSEVPTRRLLIYYRILFARLLANGGICKYWLSGKGVIYLNEI